MSSCLGHGPFHSGGRDPHSLTVALASEHPHSRLGIVRAREARAVAKRGHVTRGRRCRRIHCHDFTRNGLGRRSLSSALGRDARAHRLRWLPVAHDFSAGELGWRDIEARLRHRPRRHEHLLRHDRHGLAPVAIHVLVGHVVVVDVRHIRHVGDIHVGNIHVVHVRRARAIPWPVRLAPAQREPADRGAAAHRNAEARAADERNQCRRIHRTPLDPAGRPGPVAVGVYPATVVKGCEAPRRIVDPGPAPRGDPRPVPVTVRCPARRHARRHPYSTVFRQGAPRAVLVEVFVTGHVARDVARGRDAIFTAVAFGAPAIEIVSRCVRSDLECDACARGDHR